MIRDPERLANGRYDIVVVGGGVHGICVARDAALRGYRVALVERDDFGGATSHNSLKLVHGGMRYIQHLDFRRMRQSVRERRAWLRIAPHLVRPLKFAMQTRGHVTRGPEALWVAATVHNLVGWDRNDGLYPERHVPAAGLEPKSRLDALFPDIDNDGRNGAACWYDGHMQDADRLMMECLRSAVAAGADVVNYAEAEALHCEGGRVRGLQVTDRLGGERYEVAAAVVINAAGPWVDTVLSRRNGRPAAAPLHPHNLNMNLVVRPFGPAHAIGVMSRERSDSVVDAGGRLLFVTPWRGMTVVGTTHEPYDGEPDEAGVGDDDIERFLAEVNSACPRAGLTRDDVRYCYWGLTPGEADEGGAKRARHGSLVDHDRADGIAGLVSVVGVKWTTARLSAEQALDLAERQLPGGHRPCQTAEEPLPGALPPGELADVASELGKQPAFGAEDALELVEDFGSQAGEVAGCGEEGDDAFRTRARFAVAREMAVRLTDILDRRTSYLQRGRLRQADVDWCADMMAGELGWDVARRTDELAGFERHARRMHAAVLP